MMSLFDSSYGVHHEFDRMILVMSDIEMGSGGEFDDFPHSEFLADLLRETLTRLPKEVRIDYVFNGDTFDLLKTPFQETHPHKITEDVAIAKMSLIAARHMVFFETIRHIFEQAKGRSHVHFIVGNHDSELLFPLVQGFIKALCGNLPGVEFPGFELKLGPVFLEHGSQSDPLFKIDPAKPFIDVNGQRFLNIGWGAVALLDVVLPLQPILYFHDRLKPKAQVMAMVPEIRELLIGLSWRYWTRDFWRDLITEKDPLLKLNWSMVKEVVRRFTHGDAEVSIGEAWLKQRVEVGESQVYCIGHLHQIGTSYHGSKRILRLGCFRDEYFVFDEGTRFQPVLKSFYEIYLKADQVVGIVSRDIAGPDRSPESFPESMYDVVPKVKELLDQYGIRDNEKEKATQKAQEIKESIQAENL